MCNDGRDPKIQLFNQRVWIKRWCQVYYIFTGKRGEQNKKQKREKRTYIQTNKKHHQTNKITKQNNQSRLVTSPPAIWRLANVRVFFGLKFYGDFAQHASDDGDRARLS